MNISYNEQEILTSYEQRHMRNYKTHRLHNTTRDVHQQRAECSGRAPVIDIDSRGTIMPQQQRDEQISAEFPIVSICQAAGGFIARARDTRVPRSGA